ncbi:RNA-binding protein asd-2 isoform X1 [Drosophila albomicans]|uniref:RNA-binding protein asd-2 isoform X1 n=2 Tax=Drosophila albomicans TaxID=7291 RepID=A0A6P8YQC1_DROAB|nr:RNA-binding protein asd-2 isoform X1 [Drosophila albomicans]XP_051860344.1 RNA-binding protein asd-2 isoform X1 [Drosophila albomicans]
MEPKSSLSSQEERALKSSEKLKMLDITRDKPVKVSVKVAVPVRDHPKFNFVGKLLGPKGNSMKRLQEDTMCKMAVLGRGSMRDRRKEEELRASGDSRYAHLFEDLHVEISTFAAPAEAHARIAYALAEVRRFLVPDYHDDIRQEQMWEMQALTSTPTLSHLDDSQSPTNTTRGLGGGLADMDTSNDEKSDNETSGMDCLSPDKLDCGQSCSSSGGDTQLQHQHQHHHHPHQHHQQQQQQHPQQQQQQQQHHHHQPAHFHQLLQTHGGASAAAAAAACGDHLAGQTTTATAAALHTTAMAVALQHQLTAAGIGGLLKPAQGVGVGVGGGMSGLPTAQSSASALQLGGSEGDANASTLTLLDPPGALLHPALRNVKAINIGGGLGRKRPLLGVPRSGMNPTKRTVMSLLARAKNSQSLHAVRQPVVTATSFAEPLQMLASPFIIPHQGMDQSIIALPKESLAQGV